MEDNIIVNEQLKSNVEKLIKECDAGICGNLALPMHEFCIALTNRCNLHCIMCHFCSPEYENKTYHNEKPFMMTIEQYRKLLTREWVDKQRFRGDGGVKGEPFIINFTHGESLLNPDIVDILIHTRHILPNAKIKLLSNGTTSPFSIRRGEELIRYVDILGFSVDGCTKETFEAIRTPAKFDKVMENLRAWASLREKCTTKKVFRFNVALSQMNIRELPGLIRLADNLGGFDFIYVQPLLVGEKRSYLESTKLECMDKAEGRVYLEEAFALSQETGIRLIMVDTIKQMFGLSNAPDKVYHEVDDRLTQYCTYLRNGLMELNPDGSMREICCNMPREQNEELMKRYQIPQSGTPFEIYNSKGYWHLRKDLLEGKLINACNGCSYGNKDYYHLSANLYESKIETTESLKDKLYMLRSSKAALEDERQALRKTNVEVSHNNVTLQQQSKELQEINAALRSTNTEVSQNNATLQQRNKELQEINAALRLTNTEVSQNNATLQQRNKDLQESNAALRSTNAEVSQNNAMLQQRNKELQEINATLRTTNIEVSQNNAALQKRNKELLEANTTLQVTNAEIMQNNASLVKASISAEERCKQLEKTSLDMQKKITSLELQIQTISNSFSWKVTAPLRWAKKNNGYTN